MMNTLISANEILELAKREYPLAEIENCTFIRRGFNDHYLVSTKKNNFVLRVYLNHKYFIESIQDFQFELDLLEHLNSHKVPVANALRRKSGELIGLIETELGERAFALFPFVDGVKLGRKSIFPDQGFQLGLAMANLHLAANSFKSHHRRYKLDLNYLMDEPLRLMDERIKYAATNLSDSNEDETVTQARAIVEKLWPLENLVESINAIELNNDEFGIIHADLHLGNVHFLGNQPTLFDFDHCAYGWRAYDLAIAWHLPTEIRDAMVEGYESRRLLSDAERACLTVFANLRNLWDIGDMMATESLREYPL